MVIGKNEQEDRDPPPPYEEDEEYDEYLFFPSKEAVPQQRMALAVM